MMSRIQDDFNSRSGDVLLAPGEYEGPLVISRSCVVDGSMATLWAAQGPVLTIDAPGVTIKNLRVEVTGGAEQAGTAIHTNYPDTALSGVEVSGDVTGFPGEPPEWRLPSVLSLGSFAAGEVNTFSFDLELPGDAQLSCALKDVSITPSSLARGRRQVFIETREIRPNTILYGEIMVRSAVSRRIYLSGRAEADAPRHQAAPPLSAGPSASEPLVRSAPPEIIAPSLPDAPIQTVVRGQRVSAADLQSRTVKAAYECRGSRKPLEVDGYVFLLRENGKVGGDEDLIFFGNPASADGGVSVTDNRGQPLVIVHLDKVDPLVHRIAVCFSVYGDDLAENFSLADGPSIRLLAGERDHCRFPLSDLGVEKTVVAMELYRYKNDWKIHFVGSGYHSGLKTLCESYGVEVE